ncbi:MAG TPA: hypothetical protein VN783_09020 [Thermoanaerobaculia bacterium]|nr:hypothetical protein [Thermoanaerobaculia bacterium]
MSELQLPQAEADNLIAMEKHRQDERAWNAPGPGKKVSIPLVSADRRENFLFDLRKGRLRLSQATYQTRARLVICLIRLDLDGPGHRNPDGEEIDCPHLHLYREGYGDKWAQPIPDNFRDPTDFWVTLEDFFSYSGVTQAPFVRRELF